MSENAIDSTAADPALVSGEPDRLAEPVDLDIPPPRLPFPVVGLGASAGGVEAATEFFRAIPPDTGMAYVLVQHLPPERDSLMAEILSRHTSMPVAEVKDGVRVEPNHVYVIRPGHTLTLRDGALRLGEGVQMPRRGRPVDDFFRSLADEQRERAICVILSGMGSNGTAGAHAVKVVGGLCVAQDPESAKFPDMPRSMIEAGLADFILKPHEMPDVLVRYARHPYVSGSRAANAVAERERHAVSEILSILRARTRHDFSGYKKPTLVRRIERRMGLGQLTKMSDYVRTLRQNNSEVSALSDDLMIHVTGFFRDAPAWETLRQQVIAPMIQERENGAPIRAWVTACSSGEEAYTLAILLAEASAAAGKHLDIKIFATDTADRSLAHARAGIYPGGIESELSAERLEHFFDRNDSTYRVKKELRELVVFAPQNVLQDPPFSRLDICTCRNLLIYLEPAMQRRVMSLLHFGLREGGVLFLGTSEVVSGAEGLFEIIDKRWRIFRRVGPTRHESVEFPLPHALTLTREFERRDAGSLPAASLQQLTHRALLEQFAPPTVVVDRQHRIVFFHGATAGFIDQPHGEPTRDLLALVSEPMRGAVRMALHKAMTDNAPAAVRDGLVQVGGETRRIEVVAAPLEKKTESLYFLVSFREVVEFPAAPADGDGKASRHAGGLEEQLRSIRTELQSTIEELQGSNEELKASNEEVTSVNEELQSTNEELETSKEELQSLNEELTTVNGQLQAKMEELEGTTNDLASLLSSSDIAVVFLDTHFNIRRFTPAVRDLLELIPSDVGRPLSDLARKFTDPQLLADAHDVLARLIPRDAEVTSNSGRVYIRRVLPYRTTDNRIDGIVITFVEITALKHAESELRKSEEQYRLLVEGIRDYAIFMFDSSGKISAWNSGAQRVLGYLPAEAMGRDVSMIYVPEDRAAGEPQRQIEAARQKGSRGDERWHLRKDGTRFWGSGVLSALDDDSGETRGFVQVLYDNTERKRSEEDLRQARSAAEAASRAKDRFLANVSHELRTPLSAILMWAKILQKDGQDPVRLREGLSAITGSAESQRKLVGDLLDTSRIVAGKLRLEMQDCEVLPLMREVTQAVEPIAAQKGVNFNADLRPDLGTVHADPNRLRQVFSNLLSNAVKFTPRDGKVDMLARREGDTIEVRVRDTGDGISPDFIPHLFNPFHQEDQAASRPPGSGLGLGLSIAKQIIDLHGGQITAQSDGKGKGSVFTIRLPLPDVSGGGAK